MGLPERPAAYYDASALPFTQKRPLTDSASEAIDRVGTMLDRFLARAAEHLIVAMIRRGEGTAVVLPADEYESFVATAEVLEDSEAMEDLAASDAEPDEDAESYDAIRRKVGLA